MKKNQFNITGRNDGRRSVLKKVAAIVAAIVLSAACTITALADPLPDRNVTGPASTGWSQVGESWEYLIDGAAVPAGWQEIGTHWYLFDESGKMLTGWQTVGEEEFYLAEETNEAHPKGSAYMNEQTPDGSVVDERGAKKAVNVVGNRPNPYGYSCVEVVIGEQMVYCYLGNSLVWASPCVSGRAGRHSTTTGHHRINAKQRGRYLQGFNDNGTKYKSWVNYWMPFHNGEGLHDATWRSAFGGDIYTYGGSHGCVNLPLDAAAQLYDIVYVGMPVIVHQ